MHWREFCSQHWGTLIDINELFGLAKKSFTNFFSPIRGIESANSRLKKARRLSGVFKADIIDSGMNKVHVKDLSWKSESIKKVTYIIRECNQHEVSSWPDM